MIVKRGYGGGILIPAILLVLLLAAPASAATWFFCDGQSGCGKGASQYKGTWEANITAPTDTSYTNNTPDGDGKVWRWTFPAGTVGGDGIATFWTEAPSSGGNPGGAKEEIWVQWYWKYSSGFQFNSVGDKQMYFKPSNTIGHHLRDSHTKIYMQPQNGSGNFVPNVDTSNFYGDAGKWHKFTARYKANSAGQWNGEYEAWVDDRKISSHTDVNYDSGGQWLYDVNFAVVWGGSTGVISSTQYLYLDSIYVGDVDPRGTAPPPPPPPPGSGGTKSDVLTYLSSLASGSSNRLISGQWTSFMGFPTSTPWTDIPAAGGGRYPALIGLDYGVLDGSSFNYSNASMNPLLKSAWDAGSLVTISWHSLNPVTNTWENSSSVTLSELYTPGNARYTNFHNELDNIASGLQDLENYGVVVLFRPLHEMNGSWFWWGLKNSTQYINLWRHIHDYLTNTKGLSNLLWVYSINANTGNATTYYPGDAYVDVVGLDYYSTSGRFSAASEYAALTGLGKPVALTEIGVCSATSTAATCTAKDLRYIPQDIRNNMPNVVMFMEWGQWWALAQHNYLSEMFDDSWVITQEEVSYSTGGDEQVPSVTNLSPPSGSTGWLVANSSVAFDVIDDTAVDSTTLQLTVNSGTAQSCSSGLTCTWNSNPTSLHAVYYRGSPWEYSTTYTIAVQVSDTTPNQQNTSWGFSTETAPADTTAPELASSTPSSGQTDWALNDWQVVFDITDAVNVDDTTLQFNIDGGVSQTCGSGLSCNWIIPTTQLRATYSRGSDWLCGRTYTANIPQVKDATGNTLTTSWTFSTVGCPEVGPSGDYIIHIHED